MIKNRIKELRLVEWRKIKDLQPKNIKQIFNYSHIENSILQHGFAFPFGVWIDKHGDVYAIDGHTRIEVLSNMEGVPEMLPAFVIDVKDKKEAIKILLEVYNQRTNPIDEDVMREWLEVEEIAIEEIQVSSLNVFGLGGGSMPDVNLDDFFQENNTSEEKEDTFKIILEYTEDDYREVMEKLKSFDGSKEQIIYKLLIK